MKIRQSPIPVVIGVMVVIALLQWSGFPVQGILEFVAVLLIIAGVFVLMSSVWPKALRDKQN